VRVTTLEPQLGDYFGSREGVLVTSVEADSVAAKAGVKAGDVITALNGKPVTSPSELRAETQRLEENAAFTLGIVRDKKPMTLNGKLEGSTRTRTVTVL
jgi:serine protease Do